MTLRKKIILDRLIIPITSLIIVLSLILFSSLYTSIGFLLFYIVIWIAVSIVSLVSKTNYLLNYKVENELLILNLRTYFNKTNEVNIPIENIKEANLRTKESRFFMFDVLSIKFIDNESLYELVDVRIHNKSDWITILPLMDRKLTNHNTV